MVLRKLSIFGFKSFADKTDVEFGEGVTAVIGPNGCGKSNVIDAVRWVFGEQRPTVLRSANMQDVIFSGSQKRSALNMAEVTLTIENTKKLLPTDYHDIAITRRIYRSGESEYLINRVPCRLRDIHTMFLDTGVGNSGYTTIENGMINTILSDKAEERRVLFEEAAGIGKYKERRRDSLRQLDKTRQDLLRINDTVQEADRQVRMLARHVEKANRYKRYFGDLKALEVGVENRRYMALTDAVMQRKKEMDECEEKRQTVKAATAAAETNIEKMQLGALEQEKELEIASRNVSEANEKIIGIDRDISVHRERLAFQRENVVRCERERTGLQEQIESGAALKSQVEKGVIEHSTELDECKEKVSHAQADLNAEDAKVDAIRLDADRLSSEQIAVINTMGEHKNVIASLRSDLTNAIERRERDEKELHVLQDRCNEYKDAMDRCRTQLASAHEAHQNLSASREALLGRIETEDNNYQGLIEKEKRLEAQIDSCKSQRAFLEGLDASFEGYEAGVKAVLAEKSSGAVGIVADLVRVPEESMVGLVERVLGQSVQTVVFNTDADLKKAVEFLNREQAGYARMVSLERLRKLSSGAQAFEGLEKLRTYVQTSDEHACVADYLFSNIFLTQDSAAAFSLSLDNAHSVFVSRDARDGVVCLENGCVLAGTPKKLQPGLLQRKQQIEKLAVDVDRFEKDYQRIVHEKEICIINRDEAKFALVEVDEKLNAGRQMQQEQETTIKHFENESRTVDSKMQTIRMELGNTRERIADCEAKIREADVVCGELDARRAAVEAEGERAREGLAATQEERNRMADHLKNIELEMMALTNRINQDRHDVERLTQNIVQYNAKKDAVMEEKRTAETEILSLESGIAVQEQDLVRLTSQREDLERVRDGQREKYNGILVEIDELRKALKTESNDVEELSNRIHGLELDQTRDDQEKRRIRERIWQAYEVDLESPPADIMRVEQEDAAVTENISMFKERLRRLGDVNMAALSDFESESARLKEMTIQRDDLQTAVNDLETAIKKLDKEARVQFVATFDQVRKNFVTMFTTLFEGGEAFLTLEENVDPLEAAITINVRPAGKKMRGVNLLSGGERALTAISLLFSLYLVKPSAYCILDELDAPLDDANIGRFVNLLKKFSEQTQFIVVTHNKRTMEAADLLYGVTQQERGVSTIVSVKFEEAALQAA
jgi:chromosome segregation protein